MAEVSRRFYCHICNININNISSEFTCPVCSGGFIEELLLEPAGATTAAPSDEFDVEMSDSTSDTSSNATLFENPLEFLDAPLFRDNNLDFLQMSTSSPTALSSTTPIRVAIRPDAGRRRHHHRLGGGGTSSTGSSENNPSGAGSSQREGNLGTYDNFIRDFFISVTGGLGVPGTNFGGRRGVNLEATMTPMFFFGNPGDYAWGHDGLDSVITFLLNQMEPTGPPPMTEQKIQEIPKLEIAQEHVDKKLQCSVCLEFFALQEPCRQLACLHIYHESCIVPWLELHGTCPICRNTFADQQQQEENSVNRLYSNIRRQLDGMDDGLSIGTTSTTTPYMPLNAATTAADRSGNGVATVVAAPSSSSYNPTPPSQPPQQQPDSTNSRSNNSTNTNNNLNFHLDDVLD